MTLTFGAWLDLMWTTSLHLMASVPYLGAIEGAITVFAILLIVGLNHFTVRRGLSQAILYTVMVFVWYALKAYVLGDSVNSGDALLSTVFTFQLTSAIVVGNLLAALVVWLAPGPVVKARFIAAAVLHRTANRLEEGAKQTTANKRTEVIELSNAVLAKKNATEGA